VSIFRQKIVDFRVESSEGKYLESFPRRTTVVVTSECHSAIDSVSYEFTTQDQQLIIATCDKRAESTDSRRPSLTKLAQDLEAEMAKLEKLFPKAIGLLFSFFLVPA
jgi:hypothetical protein